MMFGASGCVRVCVYLNAARNLRAASDFPHKEFDYMCVCVQWHNEQIAFIPNSHMFNVTDYISDMQNSSSIRSFGLRRAAIELGIFSFASESAINLNGTLKKLSARAE